MGTAAEPTASGYFERLTVPRWSHAMAIGLGIIIGGESSFLAVKLPLQGLVILVFAAGAEWIVWGFGRAVVEVRDGYVRADDWRLPVSQVRAVAVLDRAETKTELRRRDDSVYRVTRGWIGPSVLLDVDDPDDLPLWLLSTRHPLELAAALADASVAQLEEAYRGPTSPADPSGDPSTDPSTGVSAASVMTATTSGPASAISGAVGETDDVVTGPGTPGRDAGSQPVAQPTQPAGTLHDPGQ